MHARVRDPDPAIRALWIARIMREARYRDVWRFVSLRDILPIYAHIRRHLGRARRKWDYLIEGWQRDGLIHLRLGQLQRDQLPDGGTHALRPRAASTKTTLAEQFDSFSTVRFSLHSTLSAHTRKQ